MQSFIAIGRLTKDVELATTTNGTNVAHFPLAIERNRPNKDGERETDFFNTVVYGKTAENCGKYLKKGSQIAVIGAIQNRTYTTKDGSKRQITEILADTIKFLSTGNATNNKPELTEISSDDLPF